MMREKAIIKAIPVTKVGQITNFQIPIPRNAKRIIAVELGGFRFPRAIVMGGKIGLRNWLFGEVRLQSCEQANIFYSGYWSTNAYSGIDEWSERHIMELQPFTHQDKQLEDPVVVDANTTIIHGVFRDSSPAAYEAPTYTVTICVWVEIEERRKP